MNPIFLTVLGIAIPFLGTTLGALSVFFMNLNRKRLLLTQKLLSGCAAGVLLAASVWSLLLPALEAENGLGSAFFGFLCGVSFFLLCDVFLEKLRRQEKTKGKKSLFVFAVTLHNLPEGLAVGVLFASARDSASEEAYAAAGIAALGIAIQNLPEGAILSLPLAALGKKKGAAFGHGVLSGVVEPLAALAALWATAWVRPLLPFVLSFAAGAMVYVSCDELIPEATVGEGRRLGHFMLALGFAVMMLLDVLLG